MNREELLDSLGPYVKSCAVRSSRDPHTQDDLIQEGLICLMEIAVKYSGKTPEEMTKLAMRSIQRRFIDFSRRRKSRLVREERVAIPDSVGNVVLRDAEIRDTVEFFRSRTQGHERDVFDLTLSGFTPNEVAFLTDSSRATVYRTLERFSGSY